MADFQASRAVRWTVWSLFTLLSAALPLLISGAARACRRARAHAGPIARRAPARPRLRSAASKQPDGSLGYSSAAVMFAAETTKLLVMLALLALLGRGRSGYDALPVHEHALPVHEHAAPAPAAPSAPARPPWTRCGWPLWSAWAQDASWFAVPAALYAADNLLAFTILQLVSPAVLTLLWNLKILWAAALWRLLLRRRLSSLRVAALVLLVVGVVVSQASRLVGAHASAREGDAYVRGVALIVAATLIAALAAATTELGMKWRGPEGARVFLRQNAFLYAWGATWTLGTLAVRDPAVLARDALFAGWTPLVWAVLCAQVAVGVAAATVFRWLDNLQALYGHSVAMLLVTLASMVLFSFEAGLLYWCGFLVCLVSMWLYHQRGDADEEAREAVAVASAGAADAAAFRLSGPLRAVSKGGDELDDRRADAASPGRSPPRRTDGGVDGPGAALTAATGPRELELTARRHRAPSPPPEPARGRSLSTNAMGPTRGSERVRGVGRGVPAAAVPHHHHRHNPVPDHVP
jgi:drug/metabolite transporter (DMT)-like permease